MAEWLNDWLTGCERVHAQGETSGYSSGYSGARSGSQPVVKSLVATEDLGGSIESCCCH